MHAAGPVQATYLYTLSNFSGRLPYDWVRVHVDPESNEIYVLYQNLVRVFSPSGMEVFTFGDDLDLGQVLDAAVDRNGDVLLLSYKDSRTLVTRCNFRGVPIGTVDIRNLPDGLVFAANRMILRNGRLYFVATERVPRHRHGDERRVPGAHSICCLCSTPTKSRRTARR